MYDYEHMQPGTFIRVFLGFLVYVFVAVSVVMLVSGIEVQKATGPLGPMAIFGFILALLHSLTVRVSRDEISLSFGVGLIQKRFLIDDIQANAIVRNYNVGIKPIHGGWAYSVWGFDAVEIQLKNGRRYRIGTDQPRELLAAIESAAANSS